MSKISVNSAVMFSESVVRRCGHDHDIASARGVVIEIIAGGKIAKVDFGNTYISEDGRSIRGVPVANIVAAK